MTAALFVYGTLMLAPVRRLHVRRPLALEPATLEGYTRHRLRGASYPGILPERGGCVAGALLRGVSPALLSRLDRWEGAEYMRRPVRVTLAGGRAEPALAYVLAPAACRRALPEDWDLAGFERTQLARWLRSARHRHSREALA